MLAFVTAGLLHREELEQRIAIQVFDQLLTLPRRETLQPAERTPPMALPSRADPRHSEGFVLQFFERFVAVYQRTVPRVIAQGACLKQAAMIVREERGGHGVWLGFGPNPTLLSQSRRN